MLIIPRGVADGGVSKTNLININFIRIAEFVVPIVNANLNDLIVGQIKPLLVARGVVNK